MFFPVVSANSYKICLDRLYCCNKILLRAVTLKCTNSVVCFMLHQAVIRTSSVSSKQIYYHSSNNTSYYYACIRGNLWTIELNHVVRLAFSKHWDRWTKVTKFIQCFFLTVYVYPASFLEVSYSIGRLKPLVIPRCWGVIRLPQIFVFRLSLSMSFLMFEGSWNIGKKNSISKYTFFCSVKFNILSYYTSFIDVVYTNIS